MLALRRRHGFDAADIASMHIGFPRIIQGRLTNKHPADLQAAQMCLPFSVALAAKVALPPGRIPSSRNSKSVRRSTNCSADAFSPRRERRDRIAE
jgi:hypothetical protein